MSSVDANKPPVNVNAPIVVSEHLKKKTSEKDQLCRIVINRDEVNDYYTNILVQGIPHEYVYNNPLYSAHQERVNPAFVNLFQLIGLMTGVTFGPSVMESCTQPDKYVKTLHAHPIKLSISKDEIGSSDETIIRLNE